MMDVVAPLSGVLSSLDGNPDPVFANRLAGDGVTIDPITDEVVAPVSGTISVLHPSHHAFTVDVGGGVQIMVHVGIDTMALRGDGFTPLVQVGDRVEVGQPVLRFDADGVARRARSLLTVVLVTDAERLGRVVHDTGMAQAGQTRLFTVEVPAEVADEAPAGDAARSRTVRIPNRQGLHARPTATLVQAAKRHPGAVRLRRGDDVANAKSLVSVLKLSVAEGDEVVVEVEGADGAATAAHLADLLAAGSGETDGDHAAPAEAPRAPAEVIPAPPGVLRGVRAAPGLAMGQVRRLHDLSVDPDEAGASADEERARLDAALNKARKELGELVDKAVSSTVGGILGVQLELLEDPDLVDATQRRIAGGRSAAAAWQAAIDEQIDTLCGLDNPVMKARASDVRDVGRRVLERLVGVSSQRVELPPGSIVVAEDVTPSQMSGFDHEALAGLVTTGGSATSHVAILARNAGIPALCAADEAVLRLEDGVEVILDAENELVRVRPSEEQRAELRERITALEAQRAEELEAAAAPARTRDGHRVEVFANISGVEEAQAAVNSGCEGVGLLRSEFLFYDRPTAPTEDEQAEIYTRIAEILGPERPFVVRTLDVGGDKPIDYLSLPSELNPFLGVRGIRVSLENEAMFREQLRAIARAAGQGNLEVMFPMISSVDELRTAKAMLLEELGDRKDRVAVGAMVEVPAAAIMAEVLAAEVDFLSIGTNDLAQYVLAMDRGHPQLARRADALHPGVLRMIEMTVKGAEAHGKKVAVCGGVASDLHAVPVLVGLGVHELSVSIPSIPPVKATLARWSLEECRALARDVLQLGTLEEVRQRVLDAGPDDGAALARTAEG